MAFVIFLLLLSVTSAYASPAEPKKLRTLISDAVLTQTTTTSLGALSQATVAAASVLQDSTITSTSILADLLATQTRSTAIATSTSLPERGFAGFEPSSAALVESVTIQVSTSTKSLPRTTSSATATTLAVNTQNPVATNAPSRIVTLDSSPNTPKNKGPPLPVQAAAVSGNSTEPLPPDAQSNSGIPLPAIIGAAVGGLVLLAVLMFVLNRRSKKPDLPEFFKSTSHERRPSYRTARKASLPKPNLQPEFIQMPPQMVYAPMHYHGDYSQPKYYSDLYSQGTSIINIEMTPELPKMDLPQIPSQEPISPTLTTAPTVKEIKRSDKYLTGSTMASQNSLASEYNDPISQIKRGETTQSMSWKLASIIQDDLPRASKI